MTTKICTKCNEEKPAKEFHKKTGKQTQSYCKPCFNEYCVDRWIKRKEEAVRYKGGKCECCGYKKNYAALAFHHLDTSEKEFSWTKMRLQKWETILAELDKCIMLCANCHAEEHYPERDIK